MLNLKLILECFMKIIFLFLLLMILYSCEFNDVHENLEKAENYYDNKNYDHAITELNKVINAKSNFFDRIYFMFTKTKSMDSNYQIRSYESKSEEFDNYEKRIISYAFYLKGNCYYQTGKYFDALDNLNKSIKLNNLFPQCYLSRGIVKIKLIDLARACADWQKSMELGWPFAEDFINMYCK